MFRLSIRLLIDGWWLINSSFKVVWAWCMWLVMVWYCFGFSDPTAQDWFCLLGFVVLSTLALSCSVDLGCASGGCQSFGLFILFVEVLLWNICVVPRRAFSVSPLCRLFDLDSSTVNISSLCGCQYELVLLLYFEIFTPTDTIRVMNYTLMHFGFSGHFLLVKCQA